jgi:intracellular multiplication protein IcmV
MAIKDIFKVSRKTFFNPAAWFSDALFVNSKITWNLVKDLFIAPTQAKQETFAEAVKRMNLSEADIQETEQRYLLFALVFLVLACLSGIYGLYLLIIAKTLAGFALALAVVALFLAQAFRYHFWYFQTKFRKLGCTFDEWWQGKPNQQEPKT